MLVLRRRPHGRTRGEKSKATELTLAVRLNTDNWRCQCRWSSPVDSLMKGGSEKLLWLGFRVGSRTV